MFLFALTDTLVILQIVILVNKHAQTQHNMEIQLVDNVLPKQIVLLPTFMLMIFQENASQNALKVNQHLVMLQIINV